MLFTSAGDNTIFDSFWIDKHMNYDIFVFYYGVSKKNFEYYKSKVKFIERRKGSKFQNFLFFYKKYPEIIKNYEYFFILDDDIVLSVDDINFMFNTAKKYDLSICCPSHINNSKIYKSSNGPGKDIHKPGVLLTYTNFIEVCFPLLNKEALDKFIKYDGPKLVGFGIDYLYIWANGIDEKKKFAIIHAVQTINPGKCLKLLNRTREHKLIKGDNTERWMWKKHAQKIGCPIKFTIKEYESIMLNDSIK